MVWVWRDTPDCATNHDLSYARSRDLVNWETAAGEAVDLPMVLSNRALIVDPIPSGGGIINGGEKLFFDRDNRPIVNYHKSDANGNMQLYATRFEDGKWVRRQLTRWDKPVKFSGGGSMPFIGIRVSGLTRVEPGVLTLTYRHKDYGRGRLVIDEQSLQPIDRQVSVPSAYPAELGRRRSRVEGMSIRRAADIGSPRDKSVRYLLQWETLGSNYDRPRRGKLPPPGPLELIEIR